VQEHFIFHGKGGSCHSLLEPALCSQYSDRDTSRKLRDANPCRGRGFFSSRKLPYRLWGPPSLTLNGTVGALPVIKPPGRDTNESLPSYSRGYERVESYLNDPPRLQGVDRNSFSFTPYHSRLLNKRFFFQKSLKYFITATLI
jgi:hypothetical protein